jgi:hypothetical protein
LKLLERDIEKYLNSLVRKLGGETRKLMYIGRNGAPDRLIMLGKAIHFVELKSPSGKLTASQKMELDALKKHGASTHVINSTSAVDRFIEWCTEK